MKRVTVGIKMDSSFIRMLNANVELSRLRDKDEMTPARQLALVVLMEARGALEGEVRAAILPVWRANIEVVSELRTVEEIAT